MLKEILEREAGDDMSREEEMIYKQLDVILMYLDKVTKKASKLKDGSRLKSELDKIGGLLSDEMEFVGRGEYS